MTSCTSPGQDEQSRLRKWPQRNAPLQKTCSCRRKLFRSSPPPAAHPQVPAGSGRTTSSSSPAENSISPSVTSRLDDAVPSWLRGLSRQNLALLLLAYFAIVHVIGLWIFTSGFLLTRLTIPLTSPAYTAESPAPLPARYSKAIILVIDALRTDFISPHHPQPPSLYHHGVLSLPAELTASDPSHSLIFNTFSDPPTSTMQRIKGITTGSLPTFIDIGSNFASTAVDEDSLISQFVAANKSVVFMGDDTWVNLFPDSFAHSHPYDSFNVEDLHSVDNGVIEHLIPYMQPTNTSKWDVLIGHFLGVDHVGHRVGPERETMRIKLKQMDNVLRQVVALMEDDTLLVLLGDHGMDSKGNHGGDSELETTAALWMYGKGPSLAGSPEDPDIKEDWPLYTFPGSLHPLRHLQQIDLVPTLALLLGIPVPYNNLGAVIPECFAASIESLEIATSVNAHQIMRYIRSYGDQAVEDALSIAWGEATASDALARGAKQLNGINLAPAIRHAVRAHQSFADQALAHLRSLWAQFSVSLIIVGISILGLTIPTMGAIYSRLKRPGWEDLICASLSTAFCSACVPLPTCTVLFIFYDFASAVRISVIAATMSSEIALIVAYSAIMRTNFKLPRFDLDRAAGPVAVLVHAISFASNSFIMWEDRMVVFLLATVLLIFVIRSPTAPTASLRLKILGLSLVVAALVRVAGMVTICREEQQPYCRVTFFAGSTPSPPTWALIAIIPLAMQLPRAIGITLSRSKSLAGPAPFFLGWIWRTALMGSAVYWVIEWAESWDGIQAHAVPVLQVARIWLARAMFGLLVLVGPYIWLISPLCISVERGADQTGQDRPVTVLGFANAFGSTYILFYLIPFGLFYLVSQPMAQITTILLLLALLVYLDVVDSRRDAILMQAQFASSSTPGAFEPGQSTALVQPSFTDLVPLALMGFVHFFATGHQAVLTSIQWKAAFVGFPTVTYPWSPILVALNAFGPFFLSAIAVPLLALWNVSPRPQGTVPVLGHTVQLGLGMMMYHTTVTLASAVCAAWLRRHLMVWKVFAPRFMMGGITLLVVDLGVILGLLGMRGTSWKVWRTFKTEAI